MKRSQKIIATIFIGAILMLVAPARAADLLFESGATTFAEGQEVSVDVFFNTEGESLNGVEGTVVFPDALLRAKEVRDGNSIVNFWIQRPDAAESGAIKFSGIIPGGYRDARGFLFSIVFQAATTGTGTFEIREAGATRNNGKGTSVPVTANAFRFSVSEKAAGDTIVAAAERDTEQPENFMPEISSSNDLFDGKWFIAFATQDKQSGIDRYEVKEAGQWVVAESPHLLRDQTLRKSISVKAIDKAGNERIVTVPAKYPPPWYENYFVWIILIVIIAMIGFKLWRKRRF